MVEENLTVTPQYGSEMSIRVLNVGEHAIQGQFYSENTLPDDFAKSDNVVINGGQTSYFLDAENKHNMTSEILLKTEESNTSYWYEFEQQSQTYKRFFDIDEGRLVWTLAVFDEGKAFSYPT